MQYVTLHTCELHNIATCRNLSTFTTATFSNFTQGTFCYRPVHLRTHVEQTAYILSHISVKLTAFSQGKFHGSFLQIQQSTSPNVTLNQDKLGSGGF